LLWVSGITGMVSGFKTEWCPPSHRNAVRVQNGMVSGFHRNMQRSLIQMDIDVLGTPEVSQLTNLVKDSFRIRPNHSPAYVDVSD
jgi:hypothetical protein